MRRIYKIAGAVQVSILIAIVSMVPVSAHVVVRPSEALTGAYQTFTVSAPNEKDIPYTTIKLDIPADVASIMPTAKPGWVITTAKAGEGEAAKVTSITWAEGSVEAGLRDDFTFSAKLPDGERELTWKAYQTYADGTTVSWDQKEEGEKHSAEGGTSGPASTTKVMAVTAAEKADAETTKDVSSVKNSANLAMYLSIASLVLTLGLLGYSLRK